MNMDALIKSLTIEEKISFCCGMTSWLTKNNEEHNIRSIRVNDGPHGLRIPLDEGSSIPATLFPTAGAFASSFDRDLLYKIGEAIAKECLKEDVDILLGPGINIKRSPLCGRNFEYYSEDPYLAGELASSFVKGLQDNKVGACIKHYAVNSQENYRLVIDEIVDERALREIYLKAFEKVIKSSNPYSIMPAYNKINGEYACNHSHLLKDILRDEWKYDGLAMSDWGATDDIALSIKNGLDIEMPSSFGQGIKHLTSAYNEGKIKEEDLNHTIRRILEVIKKNEYRKKIDFDFKDNHNLAKEVAASSFVLLKNENKVLPIKEDENVLFIGSAIKEPFLQGGGSSKIKPTFIDSLYDALKLKKNFKYKEGYKRADCFDYELLYDAVYEAKKYDKIVLFLKQEVKDVTESRDRDTMSLSVIQLRLIEELAKLNKKLIVVLSIGSAIYMPWIDKVDGVLNVHLIGQAGANAIVDTLYGDNNPSGKLNETYALNLDESVWQKYYHKSNDYALHQESIFVGYRYYDTFDKKVLFPFGHGLSYSEFKYDNLKVSKEDNLVKVCVDVTNTSNVFGKEVVQVYVSKLDSKIYRSSHELKGFEKVSLNPSETKTVSILLDEDAFTYFDTNDNKFVVEDGKYVIEVGSSSRDIRVKQEIMMEGKKSSFPHQYVSSYFDGSFSDEDFDKLLGYHFDKERVLPKQIHRNSTINDLKKGIIGSIIAKYILSKSKGQQEAEDIFAEDTFEETMGYMPLRALSNMSNGQLSEEMMNVIIDVCNMHYIKAIKALRSK